MTPMRHQIASAPDTPFYDGWKQSVVREREKYATKKYVARSFVGTKERRVRGNLTASWQKTWSRVSPSNMLPAPPGGGGDSSGGGTLLRVTEKSGTMRRHATQLQQIELLSTATEQLRGDIVTADPMLIEQALLIEALLNARMAHGEELEQQDAAHSATRVRDIAALRREMSEVVSALRAAEISEATARSTCDALRQSLKTAITEQRNAEDAEVARARGRLTAVEHAYHERYVEMAAAVTSEHSAHSSALEASLAQMRNALNAKQGELDVAAVTFARLKEERGRRVRTHHDELRALELQCERDVADATDAAERADTARLAARSPGRGGAARSPARSSARSSARPLHRPPPQR